MNLLRDAVAELAAHVGKSAMTAFTLFIAVLAMIGVTAQGELADAAALAESEQQTGRAVTMLGYVTAEQLGEVSVADVASALDRRITALGGAWMASANWLSGIAVEADQGVAGPLPDDRVVFLVDGDVAAVRRTLLVAGYVPDGSEDVYPGVAFVNRSASEWTGGPGASVTARVDGAVDGVPAAGPMSFRIVGVVDDRIEAPTVYLQLSTWEALAPGTTGAVEFTAHVPDQQAPTIRAAMQDAFDDVGLELVQEIRRNDVAENQRFLRGISQRAFLIASVITLAVASLGIANIGLSSVRERAHEFAIRRSFGYTRRRIVALVLLSNLVMAAIAGAAAVAIGLLGTRGFLPGFTGDPLLGQPPFPWAVAAIAVAAAVVAAVVGALAPAVVASRVSISTLLR